MTRVLHVPNDHSLNRISDSLRKRFVDAQTNLVDMEFASAEDLCKRATGDLKMTLRLPKTLQDQPVGFLGDMPSAQLVHYLSDVLKENGVPPQAVRSQAGALAHRINLLRAFRDPDAVIADTCKKVIEIVAKFPMSADDIRCGHNPGDVLDPYILAAAQQLMYAGDFEGTIGASP